MQKIAQQFFRGAPVSVAITALCAIVYAVMAVQSRSLDSVVWDSVGAELVLWGPETRGAGLVRALTAGFVHLSATHLVLNMLMLAVIGTEVERAVGSGPYAVAYAAGILGSSAAVLQFAFLTPTAGASGALYALMAVFVAIAYRRHVDPRPALILLAGNVVYTLVASDVSVWGHAGGLVAGALMAWPLTSPSVRTRWVAAWVALAVCTVSTVCTVCTASAG
ncbi:rhomboid family intramembrane serine protease [Corynebacterium hadale]|uniref:Rhomboid family intramembrane serine protease n=1 Tax=Corynebacterium hadale TaxID=2026255 RepID=A0AB36RQB6_9CORY|nr:rhomboid family intramembrane serine protease [Corynebacterium hadale]PAT11731.1 rhomboid family intramembrane serine protease [Corynebacterium hadale]